MLSWRIATSLLLISCSLAFPPVSKHVNSNKNVGAIYFLSNDLTGNVVIIHHVLANGTISFAGGISAGGVGSHEIAPGADPLGGQDSLVVSGNILFAVNAGSNTIAMFDIDPINPAHLTLVGVPVYSGGDFPVSITVSPTTGDVCVLNSGVVNNVACFHNIPHIGLRPIPNGVRTLSLNITSNPPLLQSTFSDLIFSPDGEHLLASVKVTSPTENGYVAAWKVNRDGSLSKSAVKSIPSTGNVKTALSSPFSISYVPRSGGTAYLTTDVAIGYVIFDFSGGFDTPAKITPFGLPNFIPGVSAPCWSVFSSKSGTFFISDGGATGALTEIRFDPKLNSTAVNQYKLASAAYDEAIGTIGNKDYLYILHADLMNVDVLSIPGPGRASLIQTFNFSNPAVKAGIAINPNYLQGMGIYLKSQCSGL